MQTARSSPILQVVVVLNRKVKQNDGKGFCYDSIGNRGVTNVIMELLPIFDRVARILNDPRSTHSFISSALALHVKQKPEPLSDFW